MKMKKEPTVSFVLDVEQPPPLSDEQKKELEALASMPEDRIDYSDVPPLDEVLIPAL